jgi:uncharacterized protein YpmS
MVVVVLEEEPGDDGVRDWCCAIALLLLLLLLLLLVLFLATAMAFVMDWKDGKMERDFQQELEASWSTRLTTTPIHRFIDSRLYERSLVESSCR